MPDLSGIYDAADSVLSPTVGFSSPMANSSSQEFFQGQWLRAFQYLQRLVRLAILTGSDKVVESGKQIT